MLFIFKILFIFRERNFTLLSFALIDRKTSGHCWGNKKIFLYPLRFTNWGLRIKLTKNKFAREMIDFDSHMYRSPQKHMMQGGH